MKSNFIQRSITGLIFVALLVGGILYSPLSFAVLFGCITALTVREFCQLANGIEGVSVNRLINVVGGVYLFFAFLGYCLDFSDSKIFIPYLFLILYLMISELYLKKQNPINNWAYSMLSQLYVALPFAVLNVLAFQANEETNLVEFNPILPLSVFIFIWMNDTGAYCIGSLIGKHRLFERISPKKSWEGSVGGGIVAIVAALVLAQFFTFIPLFQWIGLAVTVVVFGTWGDLTESLFKRQLGIKDSGNILPGHGGMLDRFDSALMAIPAAVIYLYVLTMI
ncbi:MAG: phosphatidate cytidylyltransferase [Bacteroidaceae bacterium]